MQLIRRQATANAPRVRRMAGFTLVELMVTIAVLAIVVGIGAPSFSNILHRNRLTTAANEMVATLQVAKLEAVRRNSRTLVVCPTTTATACSTADDWSRVLVFDDLNSNGTVDAADVVVRDVQLVRPGTGIAVSMGGTGSIRFSADGRARVGASLAAASVSLVSSKLPATDRTRRVQLAAGRVSVCNPSVTSSCS